MEVPDGLILRYYELATDEHPDRIAAIRRDLEQGANPRDIKYGLAETVTRLYHTEQETAAAKAYYDAAFSQKAVPDQIPELLLDTECTLIDLIPRLVKMGCASSNGEIRRLVQQGGVCLNQQKVVALEVGLAHGDVLKIGKKRFVKVLYRKG